MYVKIHNDLTDGRVVIAICDENLVGKTFSEENKEIKITERFYKGGKKSEEEVLKIMKNADNLNLVGEKTINLALKNKIISEDSIIKIKNIPHAQIFVL